MTRNRFGAIYWPMANIPPNAARFRLAHLSDPHLPLPAPHWTALLGKRLTGFLSWRGKRRFIHVPAALEAVRRDIAASGCDHIALTGDLANISLPEEFDRVAAWLPGLGTPERVSVIPGNHDAYVAVPWEQGLGKWAPYMTGDGTSAVHFPYLRRRGPIALIGLSTAVPKLPFMATGTLGAAQIEETAAMLRQAKAEGLFRVVLIHHPPHQGGAPWRKRLTDAPSFAAMLLAAGAEMVLHGHMHRTSLGSIGPIPVLGAASASAALDSRYGRAQYHLIDIGGEPGRWQADVAIRAIHADLGGCEADGGYHLALPAVA